GPRFDSWSGDPWKELSGNSCAPDARPWLRTTACQVRLLGRGREREEGSTRPRQARVHPLREAIRHTQLPDPGGHTVRVHRRVQEVPSGSIVQWENRRLLPVTPRFESSWTHGSNGDARLGTTPGHQG